MSTLNLPLSPSAPYNKGLDLNSIAFQLWGGAIVSIMVPGLGLFYSGLSPSKNALYNMMLCMATMVVITIQWCIFGFSLSFSEWTPTSGSSFIGNLDHAFNIDTDQDALIHTAPAISSIAFSFYQCQVATITASLITGAASDRLRLIPALIFTFIWTTLVYNPISYWTWAWRGWLKNLSCLASATGEDPCETGVLDFGGGGPVHIASGFSMLALCLVLGRSTHTSEPHKPHNVMNVFIGAGLLWFGWLAFNGGGGLAGNSRAAMAAYVTHLAAACGSITWPLYDYIKAGGAKNNAKFSGIGLCCGAISGMVIVTPAAGFISPWAAIIFGSLGGIICNLGTKIKHIFKFDDHLDTFAVHGVGGLTGYILTGVFAQKWVALLDNTTHVLGGAVDGHAIQIVWQIVGSVVIAAWSFVVSGLILIAIDFVIPLRASTAAEVLGMDDAEMGERAYEVLPHVEKEQKKMADNERLLVAGDGSRETLNP